MWQDKIITEKEQCGTAGLDGLKKKPRKTVAVLALCYDEARSGPGCGQMTGAQKRLHRNMSWNLIYGKRVITR